MLYNACSVRIHVCCTLCQSISGQYILRLQLTKAYMGCLLAACCRQSAYVLPQQLFRPPIGRWSWRPVCFANGLQFIYFTSFAFSSHKISGDCGTIDSPWLMATSRHFWNMHENNQAARDTKYIVMLYSCLFIDSFSLVLILKFSRNFFLMQVHEKFLENYRVNFGPSQYSFCLPAARGGGCVVAIQVGWHQVATSLCYPWLLLATSSIFKYINLRMYVFCCWSSLCSWNSVLLRILVVYKHSIRRLLTMAKGNSE